MKITVYDGAGAIGGNKILLEANGAAVSFDFGIAYNIWSSYFEEYLKPRAARGIWDPLRIGLLPPLEGIYRQDYFPSGINFQDYFEGHPQYRKLELSGILLSHAHLDHSGHISFLNENIPIYCSSLTAAIAKAIQDTSVGDFEKEVCYKMMREEDEVGYLKTSHYKKAAAQMRPFFLVNPGEIPAALQNFWGSTSAARELAAHPLQQSSRVAGLNVKRFTVDHSIFGSSAFAVETKEGWVVYTGDMRLHGAKGHLTQSFAEEVRKLNPVVLITEGTRIPDKSDNGAIDTSDEEIHDEAFVFQNCLNAVKAANGLVIADFGPRNLERLLVFLQIAKQVGRKLAVMMKDAYLLETVHACIPHDVCNPLTEDELVLFKDVKSTQMGWEKAIVERYGHKMADGWEIHRRQKNYIVCMSFLDVNELIDIQPDAGAVYIYSSSEAYTEEQKIDFQRLLNWLRLFNVKPIGVPDPMTGKVLPSDAGLHASGHMAASDLLKIIRTINPKIVIPVHTLQPDFFKRELEEYQVLIPTRATPITI